MKPITPREYLLTQPNFPNATESDLWYHDIAVRLQNHMAADQFTASMPDQLANKIILTLIDYLQDIVSDAGIWRSFIIANRELYGWSVPFHRIGEDYVDFELNREDIRFLVWYAVAMLDPERRDLNPHDSQLLGYADRCFSFIEEIYEESPLPEKFNISRNLEFGDPEDKEDIYHLGNWIFSHCYLTTPAFAMSMHEIMASIDQKAEDADVQLTKKLEEALLELPTGPLALYTPEWVYLVLEGKLPKDVNSPTETVHKYYTSFVKATGGDEIKYFGSYEEMNRFLIEGMGWEAGEEHLSMAKGANDYVLMVNKGKGMLMARNVAKCIKSPDNKYYYESYAREHAFDLLTVRGACPGDLLRHCLRNDLLPDAHFPGSEDHTLVKENADFIARCYLQLYYRD